MRMVADGVWQLYGFPRDMFNVYLVRDVVIDAATRWATYRILRQLAKHPVCMVALTHCHPDHQGSAKAICDKWNVPLACHEADVPAMEGRAPMQPNNGIIRLGNRVWSGPPHPVRRVLSEGDEVAGFRVIHAPGHTPGHIIFFRDADRVAIAGDLLANVNFLTGETQLREPPSFFCADAAQNRRSVRMLAELQPRLVCFGHGPPLENPRLLEQFATRLDRARRS